MAPDITGLLESNLYQLVSIYAQMSLANIVIISALGYGLYKYVIGSQPQGRPAPNPEDALQQNSDYNVVPKDNIPNIEYDPSFYDDLRNGRLKGPDGNIAGAQFY
jgi:hypothetical protein